MSYVGADTFLDLLTLSITSPLPELLPRDQVVNLVKKSLVALENIIKTETIYDTEDNKFFLGVCKEVLEDHLTLLNKTKLGIAATKWVKGYPDEDSSVKKVFTSIVLPAEDRPFEDKHIYQIFDKCKQQLSIMIAEREINRLRGKVKKATRTSDVLSQQIMMDDLLSTAKMMMEEIKEIGQTNNRSYNIEHIDFSDPASVAHALKVNRVVRKSTILKTGQQGLNEMLTEYLGLILGETVLFGALSHHYKSGQLMDELRSIAMYNDPPRLDDLEPAIALISLENEGHKNLVSLYRRAYANEYGTPPPPDMSDEDVAAIVCKLFSRRGWRVIILRRIGEFFSFEDWMKLYEDYKKKGIRIYVNIIDYPALMNLGMTNDLEVGSARAKGLERLYHKFANFAKHENMLNIFAHQLDTNAASIVASKIPNPIKKFHGRFNLMDAKAIYNEVDLLIFMCKETNTMGVTFLTYHWAKHRDNIAPDAIKQFFAYPFTPLGIMDDINDAESKAVRDIFAYRPDVMTVGGTVEDESIFN